MSKAENDVKAVAAVLADTLGGLTLPEKASQSLADLLANDLLRKDIAFRSGDPSMDGILLVRAVGEALGGATVPGTADDCEVLAAGLVKRLSHHGLEISRPRMPGDPSSPKAPEPELESVVVDTVNAQMRENGSVVQAVRLAQQQAAETFPGQDLAAVELAAFDIAEAYQTNDHALLSRGLARLRGEELPAEDDRSGATVEPSYRRPWNAGADPTNPESAIVEAVEVGLSTGVGLGDMAGFVTGRVKGLFPNVKSTKIKLVINSASQELIRAMNSGEPAAREAALSKVRSAISSARQGGGYVPLHSVGFGRSTAWVV